MRRAGAIAAVVWLSGSVAGCGDEAKPSTRRGAIDWVSGSRLKVRSWNGGGARLYNSLFDSELGLDCTFQTAADGVMRCLPQTGATLVFTDAACTQPIAYASPSPCGDEVSRYAYYAARMEGCSVYPIRVVELGAAAVQPSALYTGDGSGGCVPTTVAEDSDFYDVEEVDPTTFVGAEIEAVARNTRVGVEVLVGSDGTRIPKSLHDSKRDSACSAGEVGPVGMESTYCLGRVGSSGVYFSDSACAVPAAPWLAACGEPDVIVATTANESGCLNSAFYEVGNPSTSLPYVSYQGSCTAQASSPSVDTSYLVGAASSADDEILLTRTHAGDSRLVLEQYSNHGTSLMPSGTLWDTELGKPCYPTPNSDRPSYCVPTWEYISGTLFADADCTMPLVSAYGGGGCTPPQVLDYLLGWSFETCGGFYIEHIYEAKKVEPAIYYVPDSTGTCVETAVDQSRVYYALGAEVAPADTFAELTLAIDD